MSRYYEITFLLGVALGVLLGAVLRIPMANNVKCLEPKVKEGTAWPVGSI